MPLKWSHHPSQWIVLAKLGSFCCRLICQSSADQCSTADYLANHLPKTICILSWSFASCQFISSCRSISITLPIFWWTVRSCLLYSIGYRSWIFYWWFSKLWSVTTYSRDLDLSYSWSGGKLDAFNHSSKFLNQNPFWLIVKIFGKSLHKTLILVKA